MSILVDHKIRYNVNISESITIDPFNLEQLNPNSYDVTLSDKLKIYKNPTIDLKKDHSNNTEVITIDEEGYKLYPDRLYLASTNEVIGSNHYVPILEGKSSVGRAGISIHVTAGFGDLGFINNWTLEITCVQPVIIYPNIRIGQVYFLEPNKSSTSLYSERKSSKYKDQGRVPVETKFYKNFE